MILEPINNEFCAESRGFEPRSDREATADYKPAPLPLGLALRAKGWRPRSDSNRRIVSLRETPLDPFRHGASIPRMRGDTSIASLFSVQSLDTFVRERVGWS